MSDIKTLSAFPESVRPSRSDLDAMLEGREDVEPRDGACRIMRPLGGLAPLNAGSRMVTGLHWMSWTN